MRVLLINPPYQTFTSNLGTGHQIPLGLLMVGGPLIDAGHEVQLLDAECLRLSLTDIAEVIQNFRSQVVMTGHAGSTPAHPVCLRMLRAIKTKCPDVISIYGGVYPTYHATDILAQEPAVDIIVRGEGEATACELIQVLASIDAATRDNRNLGCFLSHELLTTVNGITYRQPNRTPSIITNPDRTPIANLNAYRVGWELIDDWNRYQCFGLGRAAIVQMSRGCPHRCTYCGQFGFWVSWRYRDPVQFADEIEWLYRTHDIRFFTLADENPTTRKDVWQRFLEEIIARELPIHFFTTLRATDIVRDADILPLYRKAGILYVLMGIESTNPEVLKQVRKGSTTRHDYQACRLLKQHGIYSVMGHIVGLEDDTSASFRTALQQLKHYDGDYINAMYVTPHSWTTFAKEVGNRPVVQLDQQKWDYRHQVLSQRHLKPWQLFFGVKWLELCFHLRPRKLWNMLRAPNRFARQQLWWSLFHTGTVWLAEVGDFLFKTSFAREPVSLADFQKQSDTANISRPVPTREPMRPNFDKAETLLYTRDVIDSSYASNHNQPLRRNLHDKVQK